MFSPLNLLEEETKFCQLSLDIQCVPLLSYAPHYFVFDFYRIGFKFLPVVYAVSKSNIFIKKIR